MRVWVQVTECIPWPARQLCVCGTIIHYGSKARPGQPTTAAKPDCLRPSKRRALLRSAMVTITVLMLNVTGRRAPRHLQHNILQ